MLLESRLLAQSKTVFRGSHRGKASLRTGICWKGKQVSAMLKDNDKNDKNDKNERGRDAEREAARETLTRHSFGRVHCYEDAVITRKLHCR